MVERTEMTGFDEFSGTATKVEKVTGNFGEQIHIEIEPEDKSLFKQSKTNRFHEWIRLTPRTTETSVPSGSILDLYLRDLEQVIKEAKKEQNVMSALNLLIGRKMLYVKKKLGKKFEGKEAAEHWVPNRLL